MIKRYPLIFFFLTANLISWIIWAPLYLPYFNINLLPILPYHYALGALGPILAAFIISRVEKGKSENKKLLKRMFKWKVNPFWYFVALFGPFVLFSIAIIIGYFATGKPINFEGVGVSKEFPQFSILAFLLYNIISFGYGEETGWRGYALPKLQTKYNAFSSSILLTIGWAIWHIPLFFYRSGYMSMEFAGIIGWVLSLLMGSILLTWLYNSSRGSILICALFHATIDIAFTSDIVNKDIMNYMGALITIWSILVILIAKPKNLSKEERQKLG